MSGIAELKVKGQLRQNVVNITPQQFLTGIKHNLAKANNFIIDGYGQFTFTWRHRPKFDAKTSYDINNVYTQITSDDPPLSYLDFGTSRRYAVMDIGFRAKTSARTMKSGKGAGNADPVRRGRHAPDMGGIEAREISLTIAEALAVYMKEDNKKLISGIITSTISGGIRKK